MSVIREPIAAPKTTKYKHVEMTGAITLCIKVRRVRDNSKLKIALMAWIFRCMIVRNGGELHKVG